MIIRYLRFILLFLSSILFINHALANSDKPELAWELAGFMNPESVVYDPRLNIIYVSNINGMPNDKDGNGFISIISLDGKILNKKWVSGLDAPKGLAIVDRTLYIADIDQLVVVDVDRGRITKKYKVDDAKFLNDVDADNDGNVYVSDMLLDRIHVLSANHFQIWLESEALKGPNGLHFTEDDLIVASWGNITNGFATDVAGHLQRISLQTKKISVIGDGDAVGNLDGVEGSDEIGFYVTDWMNGGLFHISAKGEVEKLLNFKQGSADLEFIEQKNLLLIPQMNENKISAYKLK